MKSKNNNYYICEDGHLTVGSGKKEKCDARVVPLVLEKDEVKKRGKKWAFKEKPEVDCGKHIIKKLDVPEKLRLDEVWDYQKSRAFFLGCTPEDFAWFAQAIQEEFVKLITRLNKLEEDKHD